MSQTEKRPKKSFSGLPFYLVLIVILVFVALTIDRKALKVIK